MASRSNKRKQTSATAVKPSPSKAVKKMATHEFKTSNGFVWQNDVHPTVFYLGPPVPAPAAGAVRIASFDMDHTLIMPSSGAVFPKGRDDWTFWDERIPARLKQLHAEGFQLLILSNQGGIGKGNQPVDEITGKICDISEALGLPVYAAIACADNEYRKPNTYMWELMVNKFFGGIANVDHDDSFYCGDAAGRPKGWEKGKKKDFSASDRKFAYNAGIGFSTPEEFFFGAAPAEFDWGTPMPKDLLAEAALAYESDSKQLAAGRVCLPNGWIGSGSLVPSSAELIVFCGPPASGKSSWAKKHLVPHGYEWINQDTLKTKEKCIARTREALSGGGRVIVDNTNPDPAVRAAYVSIAQALGIPCRCFYFRVSRELSGHLNLFREKVSKGERKRLSRVVFNVFWSKFEEPSAEEGFSDICTVDFLPAFESAEIQKVFMQLNE